MTIHLLHAPVAVRTWRVDLGREFNGKTQCSINGQEVMRTRQPIYDMARYLLDDGLGQEADRIETWRGTMLCMSGEVGQCAKWTVRESNLKLRPYEPFNRTHSERRHCAYGQALPTQKQSRYR